MERWFYGMLRVIANGSKRFSESASPPTIATVAGLGLVSYGFWMVDPALAFIVPGTLIMVFGLWVAGLFRGS